MDEYTIVGGGVFISTDNGLTWKESNNGLPSIGISELSVSGTNIYAGTWEYGGVYVSKNGGLSWELANSGITEPYIITLAANGSMVVASSVYGGLLFQPIAGIPGLQLILISLSTSGR